VLVIEFLAIMVRELESAESFCAKARCPPTVFGRLRSVRRCNTIHMTHKKIYRKNNSKNYQNLIIRRKGATLSQDKDTKTAASFAFFEGVVGQWK